MNTFKKLALSASLLVLAFAGTSQAQIPGGTEVLRITGSTAYRASVHQAILSLLGSSNQTAYVGSNIAGANQAIFYGSYTPSGGSAIPIVIKTDWTGSVGGVKALSQNLMLYCNTSTSNDPSDVPGTVNTVSAWLDNSVITATTKACSAGPQSADPNTFPGYPNGILNYKPGTAAPVPPATATATAANAGTQIASKVTGTVSTQWESAFNVADVGFSDAFQGTTLYSSTNLGATGGTSASGAIVGLVDFIWMKSAATTTDPDYAAWTHLTNVTPNMLRQLYANGQMPISLMTGNSADYAGGTTTTGAKVYAIGRDPDSGTRINAFAEAYYGVNTTPNQYYLTDTTLGTAPSTFGVNATASISKFPATTVEGTPYGVGAAGFASGGQVGAEMSAYGTDSESQHYYLLTYIALDDATSALNTTVASPAGGGTYVPPTALSWNGVSFTSSTGPSLIEQGQYSFWGFEHMYYRIGTVPQGTDSQSISGSVAALGGDFKTMADAIATDLMGSSTAGGFGGDSLVASGVPLNAMQVTRTVEGGTITHK